jgi:hypothetical protein
VANPYTAPHEAAAGGAVCGCRGTRKRGLFLINFFKALLITLTIFAGAALIAIVLLVYLIPAFALGDCNRRRGTSRWGGGWSLPWMVPNRSTSLTERHQVAGVRSCRPLTPDALGHLRLRATIHVSTYGLGGPLACPGRSRRVGPFPAQAARLAFTSQTVSPNAALGESARPQSPIGLCS